MLKGMCHDLPRKPVMIAPAEAITMVDVRIEEDMLKMSDKKYESNIRNNPFSVRLFVYGEGEYGMMVFYGHKFLVE